MQGTSVFDILLYKALTKTFVKTRPGAYYYIQLSLTQFLLFLFNDISYILSYSPFLWYFSLVIFYVNPREEILISLCLKERNIYARLKFTAKGVTLFNVLPVYYR